MQFTEWLGMGVLVIQHKDESPASYTRSDRLFHVPLHPHTHNLKLSD